MMAINGKIQREGDVVHLVAQQLFDLSRRPFRTGRPRHGVCAADRSGRRIRARRRTGSAQHAEAGTASTREHFHSVMPNSA